ncbi:MAG TPA: anti-phage dCTP deaminase [Oculatellaceae cyanobacterium]
MTSINDLLDINKNTPGPELFIGLVAPVGVDLRKLHSHLRASLGRLGYDLKEIKLSQWIKNNSAKITDSNDHVKLKSLMEVGSDCRRFSGRGEFLALAGVSEIREHRIKEYGYYESENKAEIADGSAQDTTLASQTPKTGTMPKVGQYICYILNQLKHPEEVEILRWIYGASFYLIGAYSSLDTRQKNLAARIEASSDFERKECMTKALDLIEFDYSEASSDSFGQSIQKTFPQADVFFDESDPNLVLEIDRFVDLIFSNPFHSPTKDEQGMCLAKNASYRSADLARQIGAAITTERGEIVSIGCNEAARPEGGQYWSDDDDVDDKRDFQLGFDSNDRAKKEILTDLLEKLSDEFQLPVSIDDLVNKAISKTSKLGSARLFDVIEYFRSVHAEMAALIDAARRGLPVSGATMYATTFPCHECAKHLVAAGIKRLIYIEPYPKSKALELFEDAISLDVIDKSKTVFKSFVGVAPRRYAELFDAGRLKRKTETGVKKNWLFKNGRLRRQELETAYVTKETYYSDLFNELATTVRAKLQLETAGQH